MEKCINHPEVETNYKCSKHGIYLCEDCLECKDPKLYCKFRTSCPIWFMRKGVDDMDNELMDEKSGITSDLN